MPKTFATGLLSFPSFAENDPHLIKATTPVFELFGGWQSSQVLTSQHAVKLRSGWSAIYCIHTIYITISVGLRQSNIPTSYYF